MKTLRATLNQYPQRTTIVVSVIILLVLLFVVWKLFGIRNPMRPVKGAFYTDDDGQTFFKGAPGLIVPFDHEGRQAVLAQVYTADHGAHQWVQCLVKYSDESAKRLLAASGSGAMPAPNQMGTAQAVLIKKPGSAGMWMPVTDPKARDFMQPSAAPDGMGPGPIEQVFP